MRLADGRGPRNGLFLFLFGEEVADFFHGDANGIEQAYRLFGAYPLDTGLGKLADHFFYLLKGVLG